MAAKKQKPDYRRIWLLERDLDITQAGEPCPAPSWMNLARDPRDEASLLSSVDQSLRVSGERGFL
jgi:hypothetical protein